MGGTITYKRPVLVSKKEEKEKTKFPTLAQSSPLKELCDSNSVPQWKPIYTKEN